MRCAFGGIPAGCWTPVTLHALNGAYDSQKRAPCENVETLEWETTEITMESQNVRGWRTLGFITILWTSSSHLAYIVIRCLFDN